MPYVPETDDYGNISLVPGINMNPMPNNGRLDELSLLPGDVLVWFAKNDNENKNQFFIKEFTEGPYTHAGIYIGDGKSIDAGPDGIVESELSDLLKYFEVGNVLRWPSISPTQTGEVVSYATSHINFKYASFDARLLPFRRIAVKARHYKVRSRILSLVGKLAIVIRSTEPRKKSIYCSQLVVEAYASIGKFEPDNIKDAAISPNDLLVENYFHYCGYISNKYKPEFNVFDVNAPNPGTVVVGWSSSTWRKRFNMALWGHP
jgi:hypothetical protein